MASEEEKSAVLIVDDEEKNLMLLKGLLHNSPYNLIEARSGAEALEKAKEFAPDIVLLDVMMPGMDGFEVCRRLKQGEGYLPIIMITSLADRDSRLKGIESGADDFLSKPIDSTEVELKIKNFLRTKSLYDKLEKSYQELKELEEMKDNLSAFIVHDLRGPVAGVKGYLDLLSKSKNLKAQDLSDVEKAKQSIDVMIAMISNLLDITKMESNEMKISPEICGLGEITTSAVRAIEPLLIQKSIHLLDKTRGVRTQVRVQKDLIERVVQNLLSNAVRFTPKEGKITIENVPDEQAGFIVVSISDNGMGIPEEYRRKIFDKFATVEMKRSGSRSSTGLGLTFCKLAVELHGGKIWVEDSKGGGSTFRFTLPTSQKG
ncbi:MAG: response regulator [Candidatus Omnitrophota bacterium]